MCAETYLCVNICCVIRQDVSGILSCSQVWMSPTNCHLTGHQEVFIMINLFRFLLAVMTCYVILNHKKLCAIAFLFGPFNLRVSMNKLEHRTA